MTQFTFDANIVSDLHKDVYGCRPSQFWWSEWKASTDQQRQAIWDALIVDLEIEEQNHMAVEAHNFSAWETHISTMMAQYNISKADAIRWDMDAMEVDGGVSFYCYKHGIAYGEELKIHALLGMGVLQS